MPPKRKAEADATEENKKLHSALKSVADEYVCPITQELPVNPAMAEDGRIYERGAIEGWLARPRPADQPVKSPVTNEKMGPRLLPAVQVRNSIKAMVQSGALSGDKADAWRQRLAEEEEVAATRRRAEGGDGAAAALLGHWYRLGNKGLAKDEAQTFKWFKRGSDLGHASAMALCGSCYGLGVGVAQNNSLAILYYGMAATAGSQLGCHRLGDCYSHGFLGMPKDQAEAKRWYEKMPGCAMADVNDASREKARIWLRERSDVS